MFVRVKNVKNYAINFAIKFWVVATRAMAILKNSSACPVLSKSAFSRWTFSKLLK